MSRIYGTGESVLGQSFSGKHLGRLTVGCESKDHWGRSAILHRAKADKSWSLLACELRSRIYIFALRGFSVDSMDNCRYHPSGGLCVVVRTKLGLGWRVKVSWDGQASISANFLVFVWPQIAGGGGLHFQAPPTSAADLS